jgi:hemerythrin-like domain-containing protein
VDDPDFKPAAAVALFPRLRSEHALIYRLLDAFDSFASIGETTTSLDVHRLVQFLTFIRGYVDGYHYELEEVVLLPGLERSGFASMGRGPLAHVRDEHREEGTLVLALEMAACTRPPWSRAEIGVIAEAVRTLTRFERAHMAGEQDLLFPAAEKELDSAAAAELARVLSRYDRFRAPRWNVPWLERLADQLVAAYPVREREGDAPQRTQRT